MEDCIERLMSSGFTKENAVEICKCYIHRQDNEGLESFVCSCEQYDPLKAKERENVGV